MLQRWNASIGQTHKRKSLHSYCFVFPHFSNIPETFCIIWSVFSSWNFLSPWGISSLHFLGWQGFLLRWWTGKMYPSRQNPVKEANIFHHMVFNNMLQNFRCSQAFRCSQQTHKKSYRNWSKCFFLPLWLWDLLSVSEKAWHLILFYLNFYYRILLVDLWPGFITSLDFSTFSYLQNKEKSVFQ